MLPPTTNVFGALAILSGSLQALGVDVTFQHRVGHPVHPQSNFISRILEHDVLKLFTSEDTAKKFLLDGVSGNFGRELREHVEKAQQAFQAWKDGQHGLFRTTVDEVTGRTPDILFSRTDFGEERFESTHLVRANPVVNPDLNMDVNDRDAFAHRMGAYLASQLLKKFDLVDDKLSPRAKVHPAAPRSAEDNDDSVSKADYSGGPFVPTFFKDLPARLFSPATEEQDPLLADAIMATQPPDACIADTLNQGILLDRLGADGTTVEVVNNGKTDPEYYQGPPEHSRGTNVEHRNGKPTATDAEILKATQDKIAQLALADAWTLDTIAATFVGIHSLDFVNQPPMERRNKLQFVVEYKARDNSEFTAAELAEMAGEREATAAQWPGISEAELEEEVERPFLAAKNWKLELKFELQTFCDEVGNLSAEERTEEVENAIRDGQDEESFQCVPRVRVNYVEVELMSRAVMDRNVKGHGEFLFVFHRPGERMNEAAGMPRGALRRRDAWRFNLAHLL
ncbi:unnamed protein product [Amoebophrya sp. A25]|nr:unnamed protein product [Amoebophrya sp. A25]|eukprot:GSA25T00025402001.1